MGGAMSSCTVTREDGSVLDIGKETVYRPDVTDVINIATGGGGGEGPPIQRDPQAVANDIYDGLVSVEKGAEVYGVVLHNGQVDSHATTQNRSKMVSGDGFDFGAGRSAWESRHNQLAMRVAEWLPTLNSSVRRSAQADVYERIGTGTGAVTTRMIDEALAAVEVKLKSIGSLRTESSIL